jgi:predicted ArsR family transcriptional regulator
MASHRAPDYRTLASLSRVKLLNALAEKDSLTVEELAEATGLHPNTAREHLHRLIDTGFVSSRTRPGTTPGRPRLTYTTEVDRDDPIQAEKMRAATQRAEYIRWLLPTTTVTQKSTATNRQVDMLEDHFDQCGFDATVDTDSLSVKVHVCPFEKLARDHPEVCRAHFHLIGLTLHRVDGPLEADALHRLDPVDGCSVDLRRHPVDSQSPARPSAA